MDALAILEITRDDEGHIVGLAAIDPSTIEETYIQGRPGSGDLFQFAQVIDGATVQVFEHQDLLIFPKKFPKDGK